MVARNPMMAKAKPSNIDPHKQPGRAKDSLPAFDATIGSMTRPKNQPSPGSKPSASMFDGPYGGKKPQS